MSEENKELFKQALVEGVNRRFDKALEEEAEVVIANSATTTEKQIEEMAKDLAKHSVFYNGGCLMNYSNTAKLLYNAGYRKQETVIKEFAERLKRYYNNLNGTSPALSVAYHIDQIKKDFLQRGPRNE